MHHERNVLLDQLYAQYFDIIYRQCLSIVEYNPRYYPLVEDCVQDAFLQALVDYDEYKDYKNPIGWIVRVAQNKVKSKFRDELRHAKVVSTLLPGQSEDMAFSVCAVDEELARRDTIEQIARIYNKLTDHEKKVFIAYFLNDMSQKETAESTGLTENSVRAAVKRIRKRARSMKNIDFLLFLGAFFVTLVTRK